MPSLYERQKWLKETIPQSAVVVGCGGVGSWVAYLLAMAGVPELWLFDPDKVSEHNLNRLPLPAHSIDQSKSQALAQLIAAIRPECKVMACGGFDAVMGEALWGEQPPRWFVVSTDTLASRQMVQEYVNKHNHKYPDRRNAKYIEAAAEGEYGSCTGVAAEWATEAETEAGYASVPVWVGPAVFAATMAVAHVIHDISCGDNTYRVGWNLDWEHMDFIEHAVTFDRASEQQQEAQRAAAEAEAAEHAAAEDGAPSTEEEVW